MGKKERFGESHGTDSENSISESMALMATPVTTGSWELDEVTT